MGRPFHFEIRNLRSRLLNSRSEWDKTGRETLVARPASCCWKLICLIEGLDSAPR